MSRNAARFGAGALAAAIAAAGASGSWWLLRDGSMGAVSPEQAASREQDPTAGQPRQHDLPRKVLPDEVTTPAQLREVIHFCARATLADAAELRRAAATAPDPLVAGNAIRALGTLGLAGNEPCVRDALRDERPRLRQEAVIALGRSGDPSLAEEFGPMLTEKDPTLRSLVIDALGRVGGARSRALIESVLADPAATETERTFARAALKRSAARSAEPSRVPEFVPQREASVAR